MGIRKLERSEATRGVWGPASFDDGKPSLVMLGDIFLITDMQTNPSPSDRGHRVIAAWVVG
jgi:hypothetical protein